MRRAGFAKAMPWKRSLTKALPLPMPRAKRRSESSCSSAAVIAVVTGLRVQRAIPVATRSRSVRVSVAAQRTNGSRSISVIQARSKPAASSETARSTASGAAIASGIESPSEGVTRRA